MLEPTAKLIVDWDQCPRGKVTACTTAAILVIVTLTFAATLGAAKALYDVAQRVARIEAYVIHKGGTPPTHGAPLADEALAAQRGN